MTSSLLPAERIPTEAEQLHTGNASSDIGASLALDFIASSNAVKNLFSLGVVDQSISVAIHNVDGTLLLDADTVNFSGETSPVPTVAHDEVQVEKPSQDIIALTASQLENIGDSDALALILNNPPRLSDSERSTSYKDQLGLPAPDDHIQRFLPQQSPEPREYISWSFHDINMLVGSNAAIYRSASNNMSESRALTVRVENAGNLQSLLERHEHDRLKALQNRPSYAEVTKKIQNNDTASKSTRGDGSVSEEGLLQTCIVSAPSYPVGGLLSSRGGFLQSEESTSHHDSTAGASTPHPSAAAPVSTVLDIYLDNIMANVPQLALCLQDKGFIRSVKLLSTDDIPSSLMHPVTLDTSTPFSVVQKAEGEEMFSPEVMETNASMLLRFLKANCAKNNTTYLLRREQGDANLQLYDISTLSSRGQKKWIFWLAMMSYRFANRLRHVAVNHADADAAVKRSWRARQRNLLQNTLDLLEQLADMDGNRHESLVAAVSEHMADSILGLGDDEGPDAIPKHGSSSSADGAASPACISMLQQPYAKVSVDALGKAQDHLANGIRALMPLLEGHVSQRKDSLKERHDKSDSAFRNIIEPVATQLFALHYKFVNVSLRMAEIHLSNYFSSSAMQALRTSARGMADSLYLIQLLDRNSDKKVRAWLQRIQLQYTWLWEHCGHFARSFAADSLWRERGHASGDDVVSVLLDVEAAFRNHSSLDIEDKHLRSRFIDPENLMTERTNGLVNMSSLNGIVHFEAPLGKIKLSSCKPLVASDRDKAEALLSEQRLIIRDQRKVLIAACLAYCRAIKSFKDLLADEEVDPSIQSATDTALLGLLEQRLGDSCNEAGKILLNELRRLLLTNNDPERDPLCVGAANLFLSSAQFWFFQALEVFEGCNDLRNLALLRCNLCQAYKLQANTIFAASNSNLPEGQTHAEVCLQEAINHLQAAHVSLGEKDTDPMTWNMVSEELAATFLVLGVRRRQSLIGSGSMPFIMQALRLSPGKEHSIVDPMQRALAIYEQLGNHHQAAAAHYQLALYFSKVWTCQVNEAKTREKLTLAFQHFNVSHSYFSHAIAGNEITFCLLCIDLSGLYASVGVNGEESTCKALLRCLDTLDAMAEDVVNAHASDLQNRSQWFSQMDVIADTVDERVFKALRNLVKIEGESGYTGAKNRYKDLYRIGLLAKMKPSPSIVYCGDEVIDKTANKLHITHSLLLEVRRHYDEALVER